MGHCRKTAAGLLGALACLTLVGPGAQGQQILQNGFEARGPFWKPGSSDAVFKVVRHDLTDETAFHGRRCEQIRLQVEKGSYIHYTFDLPRAPVTEDLTLTLGLKSNRPGVQLLCRMVLPRERDPKNVERPLSVLVRCDAYQSTRWKMLSLRQPVKRLREQQQLLAHQQGRAIDTTGAFIDQLVLNAFDGPGATDVFVDDLEVGPVFPAESEAPGGPPRRVIATPARPGAAHGTEVQFKGNQLWVDGKRFLMLGIRHTGTPLGVLNDAKFNTVWMDGTTPNDAITEAAQLGLKIVPSVVPPGLLAGGRTVEGQLTSSAGFTGAVARFLEQDAVLAWDVGSNLGAERYAGAAQLTRAFRTADPRRPVLGDVWDGYKGYSRGLDGFLVGTHRWPLMTALELPAYRDWLISRRRDSGDAYYWTWIQTHTPDWFLTLSRPTKSGEAFTEPVGPHPEQIRLLAYCALAAGYRGLAFWSDRFLADSHTGRDRLLAMALLNRELTLLEPMIVQSSEPEWIDTSRPEVKAAVFRGPEGILALPMWVGPGSQFVPGQAASPELTLTIPGIPVTATAWEVCPGRMRAYPIIRDEAGNNGGRQVRLKNFSLTAAVLFTSDLSPTGVVVRLQDKQRRMAREAAQFLHDQAEAEMAKVEKVDAELTQLGHPLAGAGSLLKQARTALASCNDLRRNGEFAEAYTQGEVALRALRVLMRAHWDRAVRDLDSPVSSPFAVSFFTLPRHYRMLDRITSTQVRVGKSVLSGGDFELDPRADQAGWTLQDVPSLDDVEVGVRRVKELTPKGTFVAHGGKQSLRMRITARTPQRPPTMLERTYVALHSPPVRLPPGTLVRISAWVYLPATPGLSPDGAMIFDSVGGEPLALRITAPNAKWKRYALYREVPASGLINVTLAASGLGTVYFDDVAIEPIEAAGPRDRE